MSALPPNIAELMQQVGQFQDEVAKIQATLISPKQREILSEALEELKSARVDFDQKFPVAVEKIKAKAQKSQRDAAEFKAQRPQREAQRQAIVEKAKKAAATRKAQKQAVLDSVRAPVKPKLPKVELPADWGTNLGKELLDRFGQLPGVVEPAIREGEIWEDWQWDQ